MEKKTVLAEQVISGLDDRYLAEVLEPGDRQNKKFFYGAKYAARAAACLALISVLAFSGVTAAAAGGSITAYDILHSMYPRFAEAMVPVQESCVYDGIEMRVEAVSVKGSRAEVYIAMQDLTGDRIDESMDLFDSERIGIGGVQISSCSMVSYDKETKTATFLVTAERMDGVSISKKRLSFSISRFLSGKKEQTLEIPEIDLKNAAVKEEFLPAYLPAESQDSQEGVTIRGAGNGRGRDKESGEKVNWRNDLKGCLVPEEENNRIAVTEGAEISACGFIGNRLHIQAHYENILDHDDHGFLWITDGDGGVINYLYSVSFWDEEHTGSYEEYVFDLSPKDDLESHSVTGWFVTEAELYEGEWSVRITLP